jgi:hypothetical protein
VSTEDAPPTDRGLTALGPDARVALLPLSLVRESADSYIVGNGGVNAFLRVPFVATAVIAALDEGLTLGETEARVLEDVEQEVDVRDFVSTLAACGLVASINGETLAPRRTLDRKPWSLRLTPALARAVFSTPAWIGYSSLLLFSVVLMASRPEFRPSYEDFFFYPDPAVALTASWLIAWVLTAFHEIGHLVAARAAGLAGRCRIGRRFWFIVLETDLSALWACSRSLRLQAFLAGMAFDSLVLGGCLLLRVGWVSGWLDFPGLLFRVLGLIVVLEVSSLGWQLFLVLRTDLYAVVTTFLGCSNLYRVKHLYLKKRFGLASAEEASEFANAHPRDVQVAPWFSWSYLIGIVWALYFLVVVFVPATVGMTAGIIGSLIASPVAGAVFWEALVLVVLGTVQALLPVSVFVHDRLRSRRGALDD